MTVDLMIVRNAVKERMARRLRESGLSGLSEAELRTVTLADIPEAGGPAFEFGFGFHP